MNMRKTQHTKQACVNAGSLSDKWKKSIVHVPKCSPHLNLHLVWLGFDPCAEKPLRKFPNPLTLHHTHRMYLQQYASAWETTRSIMGPYGFYHGISVLLVAPKVKRKWDWESPLTFIGLLRLCLFFLKSFSLSWNMDHKKGVIHHRCSELTAMTSVSCLQEVLTRVRSSIILCCSRTCSLRNSISWSSLAWSRSFRDLSFFSGGWDVIFSFWIQQNKNNTTG